MLMPQSRETLRFGEFELDIAAYELRRHGRVVRMERRPMDLLLLLLERGGELVPRTLIVERLWGRDVFIEVETSLNTAVSKVRHALRDAANSPRYVETVPGRGYRFIAPVEVVTTPVETVRVVPGQLSPPADATMATAATRRPRTGLWRPSGRRFAGALAGVAVLAAVLWALRTAPATAVPPVAPLSVVPLTTLTGFERGVTFSPDGRQFAFTWSGENQDNWDIYVQLVGAGEMRQLTSGPARDLAPRWSPDGRTLAYVRLEPGVRTERLRVISVLGGRDRELTDLAVLPHPTWSPDGRFVGIGRQPDVTSGVGGGIDLIPVHGGEPQAATRADGAALHWMPAFSPSGERLAYAACGDPVQRSQCHVEVVNLDASYAAAGPPRRLTPSAIATVWGLTWTRDGGSVIYGVVQRGFSYLWRARLNGSAPERLEIAGANALFPATTPSADWLAFTRQSNDQDVYRVEAGGAAIPVATSSVFDGVAQFSPDGRRIAFCSNRAGGATEVWVAQADGSRPEQLTHGPGLWQCAPSWSPDGGSIAFESLGDDRRWRIWTVGVDAGTPRPVGEGPGDRNMPSWSHDGAWIYFSWSDGQSRDIWRVRRGKGAAERITTQGSGMAAAETPDGRWLIYQAGTALHPHDPTDAPLLALTLEGGEPREIVSCVRGTAFAVGPGAIYYIPCPEGSPRSSDVPVYVKEIDGGTERFVATLQEYQNHMPSGFAVSPDGRAILYNRHVSSGEDLMLIENFR